MRILPTEEHQARKEKILQAVVHLFIKTGKPVGSSTIVENYSLSLSPATIRNVQAELEEEGYLTHPHTSAGRIPTDRGYRFYVDSIAKIQRLAVEEESQIREEYMRRVSEIEDLMLSTTRVLSSLSHCTGFVITPQGSVERLRRIEIIPISENQVLAVLVSESGMVRNQKILMDQVPDEEDLHSASRFLNERLTGMGLHEAEARLASELVNYRSREARMQDLLGAISRNLGFAADKNDLYVEGAGNILNFPEFHDYESMRGLAQLIDEKRALTEILRRDLGQSGLQVKIGLEGVPELRDFSVVSTMYQFHGRPLGLLGILGPKRMEYERMVAIVNTVADLVNQFLNERGSRLLEGNRK